MKRILIALICLVIFSIPILFVGCNNQPVSPPTNFEDELENESPENPITPEVPSIPELPSTPPDTPANNDNSGNSGNDNNNNNEDDINNDDGNNNSGNLNPPVDNNQPSDPPTEPKPEPQPNPEPQPEPEPLPEPVPIVSFDFTIYNPKQNVVYDISNNKIYVTLSENLDDNIVHFKCLVYIANEIASYQDITYNLTNADKLANNNPQNSSFFYFKFCETGTYTLTLTINNVSAYYVKTIDIIVE